MPAYEAQYTEKMFSLNFFGSSVNRGCNGIFVLLTIIS